MTPDVMVKILPVLHGDAACIRFRGDNGINRNIFIDGGFASTYLRTLKKEAQRVIDGQERIDLFVITHTDRDHISGVLKFVKEYGGADIVDEYWFNHTTLDVPLGAASNTISIADGMKMRDFLRQIGRLPKLQITNDLHDIHFRGAELVVLSPDSTTLQDYASLRRMKGASEELDKSISSNKADYSCSIEQLSRNPFIEDQQFENKVSIALVFADSHPSTIANALRDRGYSRTNKLKTSYVKLSHHASRFNTSYDLLSLIECDRFIVSANGKNRYRFPHKEALARVITNPERDPSTPIVFFFNYDNSLLRSIFSESEMLHYNFSCDYPSEGEDGITLYS